MVPSRQQGRSRVHVLQPLPTVRPGGCMPRVRTRIDPDAIWTDGLPHPRVVLSDTAPLHPRKLGRPPLPRGIGCSNTIVREGPRSRGPSCPATPLATVTIFNDQRRRLIGVVVSNANHEKRPAAEP